MEDPLVRKAPLVWWAGGLLLGLTQLVAIAAKKPLGVSTQFVVADTKILEQVRPEYVENHELISKTKYRTYGYGWWLDIGLIAGAFLTALFLGQWRPRISTEWWRAQGRGTLSRLLIGFVGGFFILLGARIGHGCTSGQFASGWAQLSLSVVPFTVGLFGLGLITARIFYPQVPRIDK